MEWAIVVLIAAVIFAVYVAFFRDFVLAKRKFRCLRCGQCCRLKVKLSESEIEGFRKLGEKDFLDESGKYLRTVNGSCKFLKFKDGITSCSMENNKPEICRRFPYKNGFFFKPVDLRCKCFYGRLW